MKQWGGIGRILCRGKQLSAILFVVFLLAVSWPVATLAAQPVTVMFDQVKLNPDVPPVLVQGRVLVPLRPVFEALGARVGQETRTVTALTRTKYVQLSAGNKQATINGNKVDLDVPVNIMSGRTMVPVCFVAEALGARVDWQANSRTVVINGIPIHYPKSDSAANVDLVAARRAPLAAGVQNPFPGCGSP